MNWNFWIAFYAAIVATGVAVFDVYKFIKSQPGLKIAVQRDGTWVSLDYPGARMLISFVNTGDEPIIIQEAGFEFGTRLKHTSWSEPIPDKSKTLIKGQPPYTISVTLDEIAHPPVLRAWAKDITGKKYRSKPYSYLEPDWLSSLRKKQRRPRRKLG